MYHNISSQLLRKLQMGMIAGTGQDRQRNKMEDDLYINQTEHKLRCFGYISLKPTQQKELPMFKALQANKGSNGFTLGQRLLGYVLLFEQEKMPLIPMTCLAHPTRSVFTVPETPSLVQEHGSLQGIHFAPTNALDSVARWHSSGCCT